MLLSVDKNVLGFNVSVAYTHGVYVGDWSEKLVTIKFNVHIRHILLLFHIIFHDLVQSVRDVFHNNIKVHLIDCVSICVKIMLHFYAKWVLKYFQNLQLTIFIPLILENFLDCNGISLSFWSVFDYHLISFVNNSKRTVSDDFLGLVTTNLCLWLHLFLFNLHFCAHLMNSHILLYMFWNLIIISLVSMHFIIWII